jgi:hypothetical protein
MDIKRIILLLLMFAFSLNVTLMGKSPVSVQAAGGLIYIDGKATCSVRQESFLLTEGRNAIGIYRKVEFFPENGMNLKKCDERKTLKVCREDAIPIFTIELSEKRQYMLCALTKHILEVNENLTSNPYFLVAVPDTVILYKDKAEEDQDKSDDLLIVPMQGKKIKRGSAYLLNILERRGEQPIIVKEIKCEN